MSGRSLRFGGSDNDTAVIRHDLVEEHQVAESGGWCRVDSEWCD